ncbi:MAG: universal stress protein [Actinomycetota bacterium]|nr:universal stress protein [Thermoleophilia bacterium]MDA2953274.1 universal stress protein [Actinomycetota bacterium]
MSIGSFHHVAACVDDATASADVIRLAQKVVKTGGRISVVHVLGGPPFSESVIAAIGGAFGGSPLIDSTASHRQIAEALLESVCEDIPGAVPVLLDPHDADSAPDAVVRWAEDEGADVLVAAAHRGALDRALRLVGSFSGHLSHHATCPVLLLPHGVTFGDD